MEDQDSGTHGDGTLDLQSEKFHRDLVGGGIDGVGQVDNIRGRVRRSDVTSRSLPPFLIK